MNSIYTISWAKTQSHHKFLFFWGHRPSRDGSIIKSCLSQWWPAAFVVNDVRYATAEHYMMAEKAHLFGDHEIREKILQKTPPKDVKDLGRQIRGFDPQVWDAQKYNIVRQGNYLKFSQNEELKQFLLQTTNKILVEASPVDAIWGIGLAEDHPDARNPGKWRGENLLGFALMEVRDQLN